MLFRSLLTCGLVLVLASIGTAADKAKKKKATGTLPAVVKEVQADKEKPDTGTITVLTTGKAKKGEPAPAAESKKITITADTKIETAAALKKGEAPTFSPAKLSDLKTDANVVVTLKDGSQTEAAKVQISAAKKKKKAKNQ